MFEFKVEVQAERVSGKFLSREAIAEMLQQYLEDANPSEIEGDDAQEYSINDWLVEDVTPKNPHLAPTAKARVEARGEK
jgi:hypothetical protein